MYFLFSPNASLTCTEALEASTPIRRVNLLCRVWQAFCKLLNVFCTLTVYIELFMSYMYVSIHLLLSDVYACCIFLFPHFQQVNGSSVNALYSTPSCYTYHVNKANQTYTTKEDDFFPYAIKPHGFLTGFYTSRPAIKGFVRDANNRLQVRWFIVTSCTMSRYSTFVMFMW